MHCLNAEDVSLLHAHEDGDKVGYTRQLQPRCLPELAAELAGDDPGEGGLAESWLSMEKNVVEGFAALSARSDGDVQGLNDSSLAHAVRKQPRAEELPGFTFIPARRGKQIRSTLRQALRSWSLEMERV